MHSWRCELLRNTMKIISIIIVILFVSACSTSTKKGEYATDMQPSVFTDGVKEYCKLRVEYVGFSSAERDSGIGREELKEKLGQTLQVSTGEMALVRNAIYLAYEQPKLSQSTLSAIETLRCMKFSSGYGDMSDKETVGNYLKYLECQSASKDSAGLYKCILKNTWPNSKVKIGG